MAHDTAGALRIVQLYPRDMNIYGDWGNTLTLKRRAERRGLETEIVDYNPGDPWPENADPVSYTHLTLPTILLV